LVELSRPDHPLLRYILLNAPGTYQHSLQVANLAEQAAEQIGANPLLTRVGALYHDCGKALNPQYFIENQIPDMPNLHDALTPEASARVIIDHVTRGEEMARRHRLPKAIIAFILEHHGTTMTRFQYGRAVNEAGGDASEVDAEKFRYPGPIPQTRETALVMLADGSEARTRAQRPPTEHALRTLIKDTIDTRIAEHQLDKVHLTPRDLNIILEIFTSTLKGVYHPRLEYPTMDQRTVPVPDRPRPPAPAVPVPEKVSDEG
jgi:putative nucleotidyltransferase with HDIG domain